MERKEEDLRWPRWCPVASERQPARKPEAALSAQSSLSPGPLARSLQHTRQANMTGGTRGHPCRSQAGEREATHQEACVGKRRKARRKPSHSFPVSYSEGNACAPRPPAATAARRLRPRAGRSHLEPLSPRARPCLAASLVPPASPTRGCAGGEGHKALALTWSMVSREGLS